MNKALTYLFEQFHFIDEAKWLRKLLALFVVYKCFYWFCDYSLLFSADTMVFKNDTVLPFWQWPAFVLFRSDAGIVPMLFLTITFIVALYAFFSGGKLRLAFFILWFGVLNINNNVYPTLSGGDYLCQHLLFFCIFLSNTRPKLSVIHTSLDVVFHNMGMIALRVQICLVYFLAGYAKLLDVDWVNGNAISDSLAVHDYSAPFFYETSGTVGQVLNYLVIWYQLLFPILIWIKKIKKLYLLVGVLQHLFIVFTMGLPSFGFIMIVAYAAFYAPFKKT